MEKKNRVSSIIIVANAIMILLLAGAWTFSQSLVVQAEMYDSIVDLLYSIIIVSGFLLSRRDRTPKYPEGLIRLEPIVASIVGTIVVGSGVYIMYRGAERILGSATSTSFSTVALSMLVISMVIKIALFYYVRNRAIELNSSSLYATSVDIRNDVFTHAASVVGYGLVVFGVLIVESVIGIIVAMYIVYTGTSLIHKNISNILGFSIEEDQRQEIKDTVRQKDKVYGIHEFEAHFTGDLVDISTHVEVEGDMSIEEGHKIETEIATEIREVVNYRVNEINIHLDPESLDEWKKDE